MRSIIATLLLVVLAAPALQAQSFQGLGDLPGGQFSSFAYGVSADGSVIVGWSGSINGPNGLEAFRWTASGGLAALGDIPGVGFRSRARGVSADGSVVVGDGNSTDIGKEAFRWTAGGGMVGLGILGPLPGGATNSVASGASADGSVVVGNSTSDIGSQAFRWTEGGGMVGLGDLPGGFVSGEAVGVSADGSVVVGWSYASNGPEAILWTEAGGMQGLGFLPGAVSSQARGVSSDGTVVVGTSGAEAFRWTAGGGMQGLGILPGQPNSAANAVSGDGTVVIGANFIWTEAGGMRDLQLVLEDDYGLDLTGWTIGSTNALSADGSVIVGNGTNPQGLSEAWRAELPAQLAVHNPGNIVVSGESKKLRWTRPESIDNVDVYLLPDTLGAEPLRLDFLVADKFFNWTPPADLYSRSARIRIFDSQNESVADTSRFFNIKPYSLTRLNADSTQYVPFEVAKHGWTFQNNSSTMFPISWWLKDQFNYYTGTDPLSLLEYPSSFALNPVFARRFVFPDWPAFARAFGTDDTYEILAPGSQVLYSETALAYWGAFHGGTGHNGSCYGLATSSLLAFTHREAFGTIYPAIGMVDELGSVVMSPDVRETIHEQYVHQRGTDARAFFDVFVKTDPRTTLAQLKTRLLDADLNNAGTLTIKDVATCSPLKLNGGHSILPYRLERVPNTEGQFRVFVHDSNWPADDTRFVAIDSTMNTWSYAGGSFNWGGNCAMFLRDPIVNYLDEATPPFSASGSASKSRGPETSIYVSATSRAAVTLTAMDGSGSVGYDGTSMINTMVNAVPDVPDVGGLAPPLGYTVPAGAYTLSIADPPDALISASIFDTDRIYSYGRQNSVAGQVDSLTFDPNANDGAGEITARLADMGTAGVVTLRAIVTDDPSMERTLDVRDITLSDSGSVTFAAVGSVTGPTLRLVNGGANRTYTLRLREAGASGAAEFAHASIPLVAGATHTVSPSWSTIADSLITVEVDLDGDGSVDETLELVNNVAIEPGDEMLPQAFGLHAAYPNPFSQIATIPYDVAQNGHVSLAIFDILGHEVAVLVDGILKPGHYETVLDGTGLASGLYLVRMTTNGYSQTSTISLLR